jgi:nicotinic acid mononucleotide adenylyltransferase
VRPQTLDMPSRTIGLYRKRLSLAAGCGRGLGLSIFRLLNETLHGIQRLIIANRIDLRVVLNTSETAVALPIRDTGQITAQVGVLPVTGNPLHWGHILAALMSIRQLRLSAVVFLVQGEITQKSFLPDQLIETAGRHRLVKTVLDDFAPLLRYSDVGMRSAKGGAEAIHDLSRLNRDRAIDFVYLFAAETPGRLWRVLNNLRYYADKARCSAPATHTMSIGLLERDRGAAPTDADIAAIAEACGIRWKIHRVVDSSKVIAQISSTRYRESLDPALVPPQVHEYVIARGYYGRAVRQ